MKTILAIAIAFILIGCEATNNGDVYNIEDNATVVINDGNTNNHTNNENNITNNTILYDFNLTTYIKPNDDLTMRFDKGNWDTHNLTNLETNVGTSTIKDNNITLDFNFLIPQDIKDVINTDKTGTNKYEAFFSKNNNNCKGDKEFQSMQIGDYKYRMGLRLLCKFDSETWYLYFTRKDGLSAMVNYTDNVYYLGIKD